MSRFDTEYATYYVRPVAQDLPLTRWTLAAAAAAVAVSALAASVWPWGFA